MEVVSGRSIMNCAKMIDSLKPAVGPQSAAMAYAPRVSEVISFPWDRLTIASEP